MRVVIATVQVPFVRGGAEILAEGLLDALRAEGHVVEIVAIPFKWYPPERIPDHMLANRLLDLTESVGTSIDRLIGLKFPAYLIPHPNKVLWIIHQHRTAYELWDHPLGDLIHYPNGPHIRDTIRQADRRFIAEAKVVFTISANVSQRLKKYCGIDSTPLYHPPQHAEQFYCTAAEDYFFFPSRLTPIKRQALVLEALAHSTADLASYAEELKRLAQGLNVQHRVEWLGNVTEVEKRAHYAHAVGVIFPPVDEDYGYVTLEAMLASKPVITCTDSGGPLEFVRPGETGLIVEYTPEALAVAMDTLWKEREQAKTLGEAGLAHYQSLGISWRKVVQELLACD
jgi:glycosyltransferase involved in cell wall biosynthesis